MLPCGQFGSATWKVQSRESVSPETFINTRGLSVKPISLEKGEGETHFISSLRLSHKKVNPRRGENCVASFCQNILPLIGLEMLPVKYFFNPRGSTRIDSWIRLLLTAQVLI